MTTTCALVFVASVNLGDAVVTITCALTPQHGDGVDREWGSMHCVNREDDQMED